MCSKEAVHRDLTRTCHPACSRVGLGTRVPVRRRRADHYKLRWQEMNEGQISDATDNLRDVIRGGGETGQDI